MPDVVASLVKLFADDTKLLSIIKCESDIALLQEDLDKIKHWSNTWRINFNTKKCKVLRVAKQSAPTDLNLPFTMSNECSGEIHYLEETRSERDLGITIKHNLKWDDQVKSASAKANKALGTLQRTFKCWDLPMLKQLFTVYVRPHLEYAIQAWRPYNSLDIDHLERIQIRAARLVREIRHLDHETRLAKLGLTTLVEKWKDSIQMLRISSTLT
jgi:hypothetical protein